MKKKSQMELLGLAIVVVLLIIGTLFMIGFLVHKKPDTSRREFVDDARAAALVNALLATHLPENTPCETLKFSDGVSACAEGRTLFCVTSIEICDYMKEQTRAVFAKTFDEWNAKYSFTVEQGGNTKISSGNYDCDDINVARKIQHVQPLPTKVGTANIRLVLC